MNSKKLKPCPLPLCGGEAELKDMAWNRYHIRCQKCGLQLGETWGDDETPEELIEAWNKRKK